jgi:hypothetical protein
VVTAFVIVAIIIAAFFGFGILLGVLAVIALGLRGRRPGKQYRPFGRYDPRWRDGVNRPGWQEPPGPDDDENPPRWPERRG